MKQNSSQPANTIFVSGEYRLEEQVRRLRQEHGGETRLESEERKGSISHFSLPLT